jgi:hypothetical protein
MKPPEDNREKPALTRADIEAIMRIDREHAQRLHRLKQAILDGDTLLERALAREIVGLPKEITQ